MNSFQTVKQKFINMANTRVYESRRIKNTNTKTNKKGGFGNNKIQENNNLLQSEHADSIDLEIRKVSKSKIDIHHRDLLSIDHLHQSVLDDSLNSHEIIDISQLESHKSDLDKIIDEFYALK